MRKVKRNTKSDIFAICIMTLALITGCWEDKTETPESITVFAAASTTNAITDIANKFTEATGISIITSFASSSTLAQQIDAGADADVYISANQKWADYLEQKELCKDRKTIVGNRIVIIVPQNSSIDEKSASALLSDKIVNIAMGDPAHVPAGKYGKEALLKAGIWDQVSAKVTSAKDVRSALAYVETQAAEAGIVYSTDASISDKVKVLYMFPEDATAKPISYPALILSNAKDPESAKKFFDFLSNDAAKDVFEEYGFIAE